jgi:chorismate mutase
MRRWSTCSPNGSTARNRSAGSRREAEQIARLRRLAADARLDPEFAEKFLGFIVAEVLRHHEAIARDR